LLWSSTVTPASGAIGAASEVPGMARKSKQLRPLRKWLASLFFSSLHTNVIDRSSEPKVNGGRNADLGTDNGLPEAETRLMQLSGGAFLVLIWTGLCDAGPREIGRL
jgi:hypothetical protein